VLTEPGIRAFNVWEGPGTFVNGVEQTGGFIIDWSKGIVAERPAGLQRYEVRPMNGIASTPSRFTGVAWRETGFTR